ncbi:hypothetical protein WJX72_002729 [[Myrmecia] bisecta]|uniref:Uncharacterized protein n=1 Tax=[Myrmecia] bisecta TaxID=41462 RepID=A0AAW1QPR0_9CHLO
MAPQAPDTLPNFGFVFDIDGVLIRGFDILPHAKEALRKVHDSGVPYLFVTNNGMDTEEQRAAVLSKQFDIPVTKDSMVLNHSALQNHAEELGDQLVLVTGYSRTCLKDVLRSYGFKKVATVKEYSIAHPHCLPNKRYPDPPEGDVSWAEEPVAAVIVVETPEEWHEDLQVICDLLRSDGRINHLATDNKQHVKLFNCNFDFLYAEKFHTGRFGPGAFMQLLEHLFSEVTDGRRIEIIRHGKPNKPAYAVAAKKLQHQLDSLAAALPSDGSAPQLQHIYAIGDNPKSDVRGANSAGGGWRSILVRTGVFKGGPGENDPTDPAHYVVEHVGEAVATAFQVEEDRSLGRRTSISLHRADS